MVWCGGGVAYRDLKEPEGWVFSSLRKMLHPAAREMVGEKMRGVSTQGLGGSGEREPMFVVCWVCLLLVVLRVGRGGVSLSVSRGMPRTMPIGGL